MKELILLGLLISILLGTTFAYAQIENQSPFLDEPDGGNMSGSAIESNMSDDTISNSPNLDSPELQMCIPGSQPDGMCRDSGTNTTDSKGAASMPGGPLQ